MPAYNYMDQAILGLVHGVEGMRDFIETWECMEAAGIAYGAPVFSYAGTYMNARQAFGAHRDTATLTLNGALTSSDTAIIVTLNGTALDPIAYASSDTATGNAVAAAILAAITTDNASATYNASTHVFTVFTPGFDITCTLASSGGVTSTTTYSTQGIFVGTTGFTQMSLRDSAGGYVQYMPMNVAYFGFNYVQTSKGVSAGSPAYVIYAPGATQGQFTDSSSGTAPTKALFRSTVSAAGIADLELRGKQNAAGTL